MKPIETIIEDSEQYSATALQFRNWATYVRWRLRVHMVPVLASDGDDISVAEGVLTVTPEPDRKATRYTWTPA